MEAPSTRLPIFFIFLLLSVSSPIFIQKSLADGVTPDEAKQLRDEVRITSPFFLYQLRTRIH